MNPSDLLDCRWYWREGMAVGAVLALTIGYIILKLKGGNVLTYTTRMTLDIEVTDDAGFPTGLTVPVTVELLQEVDEDYGSDADGRRGMPHISYALMDLSIDHNIAEDLTVAEVDQVISEARAIIEERTKHSRRIYE